VYWAYFTHTTLNRKVDMNRETPPSAEPTALASPDESTGRVSRLSFLATGAAAGVGAAFLGPLGTTATALAQNSSERLTKGDVAILRFLAAAELIEADLWQQYDELGGVNGGNPAYQAALANIDSDMPTYIHLNNNDEQSHAAFLNAYLESKGADPVNLDKFRTLPSSKATGAKQVGRLTSLTSLMSTRAGTRGIAARPIPTLGRSSRRRSRFTTSRRSQSATPTFHRTPPPRFPLRLRRKPGSRRSRAPRHFTSASSSRAEPACTRRWPKR